MLQSPWARSWIMGQMDKSKPARPRDWAGEALLIVIAIMMTFIVAYHLGRTDGLVDGNKLGQAELWSRHNEQFSKVQWVFDDADLRRMYERR